MIVEYEFPALSPRARTGLFAAAMVMATAASLIGLSGIKSPLIPLGIWFGLGLLVVAFRAQPTALELLFLSLPPILVLLPAALNVKEIYLTIVWLVLLLAVWYVKGLGGLWSQRAVRTPYALPFIFYILIFIASDFINPKTSSSYTAPPQVISLIFFYWLLAQVVGGKNLIRLLKALLIGCAVSCLGFAIAFSGSSARAIMAGLAYGIGRPDVLNANANAWALYPMIGLPILIGLILYGGLRRRDGLWILPVGILLSAVAIINMSRSALLGIFMSLLFAAAWHRRARTLLMIGTLCGTGLLAILKPEVFSMIGAALRLQRGLSGRQNIWPVALDLMGSHPFLGIGPGCFKARFFFHIPFMTNGLKAGISQPSAHNAFLAIGADLGVFALLLALFIFGFFAYRSFRLWKKTRHKPNFLTLVIICSLMMAGFMRALFETDFIEPHGYITENLLLLTLLAFQDRLYAEEYPAP